MLACAQSQPWVLTESSLAYHSNPSRSMTETSDFVAKAGSIGLDSATRLYDAEKSADRERRKNLLLVSHERNTR
jgi:hypothetical protein